MSRHKRRGPTQRQLRVGEELRHVLAEVLSRGELRDPVLVGRSITVSEVRVTPDMRHATAYVMPLADTAHAAEVAAALNRAAAFLSSEVGRRVSLKFTPSLRFEVDTVFDEARRIDDLLRAPRVARDLSRGGGDDAA